MPNSYVLFMCIVKPNRNGQAPDAESRSVQYQIPPDLYSLALRVAAAAAAAAGGALPTTFRPDVCLANYYSASGKLGMHQVCFHMPHIRPFSVYHLSFVMYFV